MLKSKAGFLTFLLFLVLGILLFWLSLRKLALQDLIQVLGKGNFLIALPVFAISLCGYWFRIKRWQLMLQAIQLKAPANQLFASLCVGYLVNYAFPRLGEITRCLLLKRTSRLPVDRTFITIIAERTFDTICLLILLLLAWVAYADLASVFFVRQIWNPVNQHISNSINLLIVIGVGITLLVLFIWWFGNISGVKIQAKLEEWKLTFLNVIKVENKFLFLFYTIGIWCCYFLMTFLWFFTFDESSHLQLSDAFLVMVIGSIGRSIPIQGGGIGAYHFLVSQSLLLFGIPLLTGNALALVIHGAQSFLTLITGIICYLWILVVFKEKVE
jgi:uncharacterized membrane protein YbhN (UPF0104 family)